MSFLNSILSSIGGDKPQSPALAPQTNKLQASQKWPGLTSQKDGEAGMQQSVHSSNKRRADDDLSRAGEKTMKTNHMPGPGSDTWKVNSYQALTAKSKEKFNPRESKPVVPYQGTGRPDSTSTRFTTAPDPVKSDSELTKKEPKKGSYAEIMARAKASQAKPQAVGTISHKAKEKGAISYKKELKLQKKALKDKKLGLVRDKDGSRPSSSNGPSALRGVARKGAKPEPAKPMKPKIQPTYMGTLKPASGTAKAKSKGATNSTRRANEYAATDDELDEEEEDEDDDYGYDNGDSDDMEAGFSDVEQEESAATQAARKEDEEEARLEANLKRDKEERRKRMADMAKRAKPQRY